MAFMKNILQNESIANSALAAGEYASILGTEEMILLQHTQSLPHDLAEGKVSSILEAWKLLGPGGSTALTIRWPCPLIRKTDPQLSPQ